MAATLERALRDQLLGLVEGGKTFRDPDDLLDGWPADAVGRRADGHPHTAWQLVWHIQAAQRDLIDFARDPDYRAPSWPDEYWPESASPTSESAWGELIDTVRRDRDELRRLLDDAKFDLLSTAPTGDGETFLRSVLMAIEHNAYHLGQLAVLKRALGVNSA